MPFVQATRFAKWRGRHVTQGAICGIVVAIVLLAAFTTAACQREPEPEPKPVPVEPEPEPEPEPKPAPSPCPSPKARDIIKNDSVVKDAMKEAWRRSKEGQPDEHEESFWVVQRRTRTEDGWDYSTDIVWDEPGSHEASGGSNKPRVSGGRIVLHHHTHPGPAGEAPPGECYNECASETDEANVEKTGVPSTYSYGSGPDPAKTRTNLVPLPDGSLVEEPTKPNWRCPPPGGGGGGSEGAGAPKGPPVCADCARSTGDPHLETHDGARYDLQAAGEFHALVVDGESLLQLRMEPWGSSRRIAVTTGVAMRVGPARVTVRPDRGLYVDGEPVELGSEGMGLEGPSQQVAVDANAESLQARLSLNGGGRVSRYGDDYVVEWPRGYRAWVQISGGSLNVYFDAADLEETRGLFGSNDADPGNDFVTASGRELDSPLEFSDLYGVFAESWRLTPQETLFDYQHGETTESFTDRTMPEAPVQVGDLDPTARREAERTCEEAGVTDPQAREECILDVALTGDRRFAATARTIESIRQPPEVRYRRFDGLASSSGAGGFRVSYRRFEGNRERTLTLSSDPPRETLITEDQRIIFDGEHVVSCTGSGATMQCVASDSDRPTDQSLGTSAFGFRVDEEELASWREEQPSEMVTIEERTITGRSALCKSTSVGGAFSNTVCYDQEHAVLLAMQMTLGPEAEPQFDMTATSFGRPRAEDFHIPQTTKQVDAD